jgi:hypothetical protein
MAQAQAQVLGQAWPVQLDSDKERPSMMAERWEQQVGATGELWSRGPGDVVEAEGLGFEPAVREQRVYWQQVELLLQVGEALEQLWG